MPAVLPQYDQLREPLLVHTAPISISAVHNREESQNDMSRQVEQQRRMY